MAEGAGRSVSLAATGAIDSGDGWLLSCSITSAADAATAVIRTGGASGTIICKLAAPIGTTAERQFMSGIPYSNLHVTITGTSPVFDAELG
jgi:hypothetical protein